MLGIMLTMKSEIVLSVRKGSVGVVLNYIIVNVVIGIYVKTV